MLAKKEYSIGPNMKISQTQAKNSKNREVITYHVGKLNLTKVQAIKLITNLDKLIIRESKYKAKL